MMTFDPSQAWPNALDALVTVTFLAMVLLVPAVGYVFMALDVQAHLRSLRRGLVVVGRHIWFVEVPDWARYRTPRAIAALGLRTPCTEDDLMRAYRARVMQLHPDHGGDQRRFLLLQANFEEAMAIVRASSFESRRRSDATHVF